MVGTGNFHEGNAKVYTDYFLMTANPAITKDVAEVFSFIKRPFKPVRYRNLLVSPNHMREEFKELIEYEINRALQGKRAFVHIKINHITDEDMVALLYRASRAGVEVRLSVRGNCSLKPGVEGISDNIIASGIIDRYLEHSRLFHFHAGGKEKVFLGSADWMPRNLNSRVEVITPVLDPDIKADVINTIDFALLDNTQARVIDGEGSLKIQTTSAGEPFVLKKDCISIILKSTVNKTKIEKDIIMKGKTYAAIDIGSNAARLLIKRDKGDCDDKLEKLMLLRVPLRLGFRCVFKKQNLREKGRKSCQAYESLQTAYENLWGGRDARMCNLGHERCRKRQGTHKRD